jgi:hypothetical protein
MNKKAQHQEGPKANVETIEKDWYIIERQPKFEKVVWKKS